VRTRCPPAKQEQPYSDKSAQTQDWKPDTDLEAVRLDLVLRRELVVDEELSDVLALVTLELENLR